MGVVTAVHHIHFESRDEGFFSRLLLVGGNALGPQLLDGAPIRHDEPVVSPPLFEHLGHKIAVGRSGSSADVVETAHHRCGSGLYARLVGRQVGIPERLPRNLRVYVVAARLRSAVTCEMFEAGSHMAVVRQIVALIALHRGRTEDRIGVGVLAVTFGHTPPAGIARHVDHRGEGPVHSRHPGLLRGDPGGLFHQGGIPRTSLRQRDRIGRAETVYHVVAEEDRNAEPRLLHGFALHPVPQLGGTAVIDERADFGRNVVHRIGHVVGVVVPAERILIELHDLLFEGHSRQQVPDALLDGAGRILVNGYAPMCFLCPGSGHGDRRQAEDKDLFHSVVLIIRTDYLNTGLSERRIAASGSLFLMSKTTIRFPFVSRTSSGIRIDCCFSSSQKAPR